MGNAINTEGVAPGAKPAPTAKTKEPPAPKYLVTSTPHMRHSVTTRAIMTDVLIGLAPAAVVAVFLFGINALLVLAFCIVTCVALEWGWCKFIARKDSTIHDLSAVVTGVIIAFTVSAEGNPWWLLFVGCGTAIIIIKQLFGGIGHNFLNPALVARLMMPGAYAAFFVASGTPQNFIGATPPDVITQATPLATWAFPGAPVPTADMYMAAFLGNMPGSMGEVSAAALLLGGLWLLYRKVITWHIPVIFIGTVFVLTFIFGGLRLEQGLFTGNAGFEILLGGLFLGSIFMATDYASSPITIKGKVIYALACGTLTFVIRHYGAFFEGVALAILVVSLFNPLIDKYTRTKVYGIEKTKKA